LFQPPAASVNRLCADVSTLPRLIVPENGGYMAVSDRHQINWSAPEYREGQFAARIAIDEGHSFSTGGGMKS
jgi:hypothetical protein